MKRKLTISAGFVPTKVRKYTNTASAQRASVMRYSRNAFRTGQENNYVDLAQAAYANDTTGSITLLNTVAQGASVNQRVGKKWKMKSIQVKGFWNAGTTGTFAQADNLLVYDKKPTGSLPAITDVLVTANSNSFNNDNNADRFTIVRRWHTVFQGGSTLATNPVTEGSAQDFDYFVPLGKPVVNKAAGTGAIADIETGALYFISVGNVAAGTAAATTSAGFRIRFQDM